jgi:replication factor A1
MEISEVREGMRRVDVEGTVRDLQPARTVTLRAGGETKVLEAFLYDESGSAKVKINFWGDEMANIAEGVHVKVTNGYITSFRGELGLNIGKYGKLEVL